MGRVRNTGWVIVVFLSALAWQNAQGQTPQAPVAGRQLSPTKKLEFFPVTAQFSPVPSGKGWIGKEGPIDEPTIRDTIDNLIAHGFTGIQAPTRRPPAEEAAILAYAQSRGMVVTYELGGLEIFGREQPPTPCVYSPEYAKTVRGNAERSLASLKGTPRLYNVFTYQDEPFHWGPKSFDYSEDAKAEFKNRHGYDLPTDPNAIRNDPKRWLDLINFQSDTFRDGWRQVYKIIKEIDPEFKVILTHDSHNTFGGGYGSHAELFIDDVGHWGGDFADTFIFDIYPYMMFDFRVGEPSKLRKPRISQTHYSFAQMRSLATAYGKELGFWVGTYNPAWFKDYMGPQRQATYWSEREMSTTAVAQGGDFLLTGYHIPSDARHWESFGKGLRLIQKAGAKLLEMPKQKARAAMLFPRTQLIQVQEEYFNVGLSYELFLRAFGELDILHEDQIKDEHLDGYRVLVLFDVTMLPADVAKRIVTFVRNGGVVIADCLPGLDGYKRPTVVMEDLFGAKNAKTDRIQRSGYWLPIANGEPHWEGRRAQGADESKFATDAVNGRVLGQPIDLTLVSPRPATTTTGEVLLKTASGQPAVIAHTVGKGRVFLLGFCLQDTYFQAWQDDKPATRDQLAGLLRAMTDAAGVRAHVRSSNPDVEASVRANASEGVLFIINHEAASPHAVVSLSDLGFEIGRIVDLSDGMPVPFTTNEGVVALSVSVPLGETRLLRIGQPGS
jgi:hypothetical protein